MINTNPDITSAGAGPDDAPFNFSLFYYISLNKLIDSKDQAYINNDFEAYYKNLDRIYYRVCFKLRPEERSKIEDKLSQARSLIYNQSLGKASDLLHELDREIIILMDRYKMIFPRGAAKGFEALKNRYPGLEESYNNLFPKEA